MLDYISFFGERMSVKIFASLMNKKGIKASSFVSGDIGMITDSNFDFGSMQSPTLRTIDLGAI
jgi:aspartokinase